MLKSFLSVPDSFTDKEVLKPDFREEIARVMVVMRPLVHL